MKLKCMSFGTFISDVLQYDNSYSPKIFNSSNKSFAINDQLDRGWIVLNLFSRGPIVSYCAQRECSGPVANKMSDKFQNSSTKQSFTLLGFVVVCTRRVAVFSLFST